MQNKSCQIVGIMGIANTSLDNIHCNVGPLPVAMAPNSIPKEGNASLGIGKTTKDVVKSSRSRLKVLDRVD